MSYEVITDAVSGLSGRVAMREFRNGNQTPALFIVNAKSKTLSDGLTHLSMIELANFLDQENKTLRDVVDDCAKLSKATTKK